jgi:hypothetical protein
MTMDRSGTRAVAWVSGGIIACGILLAVYVSLQIGSGNWVSDPPPPGFGMGGPDDGMNACLEDVRRLCPNATDITRVGCIAFNRPELSASCLAALDAGD